MKTRYLISAPILAVFLFASALASAHEDSKSQSPDAASPHQAASHPMPAEVQSAVETVDRFSAALKAGDLKTVKSLLDPDVLILESGGAERNRQEYLSHHASSDVAFLKDAQVQLLNRTAKRGGDLVWVGSESEIHTLKDAKPFTLMSAESMVLKKTGESWRIVHIHWSSTPKV